jgi:hypothetical protein
LLLVLPLVLVACNKSKCYFGRLEWDPGASRAVLTSGHPPYDSCLVKISGIDTLVAVDGQTGFFSLCRVKDTFGKHISVYRSKDRITCGGTFHWSDDPAEPCVITIQEGLDEDAIEEDTLRTRPRGRGRVRPDG